MDIRGFFSAKTSASASGNCISSDNKRKAESPERAVEIVSPSSKSKRQKVEQSSTIVIDDDDEPTSPVVKSRTSPAARSATKANKKVKSELDNNLDDLTDKKIAVTGVFDGITREEMEDYILSSGAKFMKSVSGKTDCLLVGKYLEDGRPSHEGNKYKTAKEKNVKIIFQENFSEYPGIQKMFTASAPTNSYSSSSYSGTAVVPGNSSAISIVKAERLTHLKPKNIKRDVSGQLWVDKYKPKEVKDIVGSAETVRKLTDWLANWDNLNLKNSSKSKGGGVVFKAALLSGPPGIGKTTLATLVAKSMGYDAIELNASDTRNKKGIHDFLTDLVQTQSFNAADAAAKRIIVMDEVDGMGGSDRGGMAELLKIMKTSKVPIVCICNDRQSQKIKSLVNYCLDLRVKRPTKQQIAVRLVAICREEGVSMDTNAAELLVEQVGNDIRQAINAMQMWKISGDENVSYTDMKSGMSRIEKDKVLRQSPFDACNSILGGEKMPLNDRYNSFFIDYSLVPLLVQQNYIDSAKSGLFKRPTLSEVDKLELLSTAADAASDMAIAGSSIMGQDQHWELLPVQAAFATRVGSIVNGFQPFPSFPAWLGKYSSTSRRKRLVTDLVHHTSLAVGQTFNPLRLDYTPYFRSILIDILQNDGVEKMVEMMDDYGLSKDDFSESLKELQFEVENDKLLVDKFKPIDSKLKAAFTRHYNSIVHRCPTLVTDIVAKKKGSRADTQSDGVIYDEDGAIVDEGIVEDLDEEDEKDDEDISSMLLASKKKPTAAKKAAATKGKGKSKV